MSQIPIGWLMKIEGFGINPFDNREMMIDGIPAPGPSIFTRRTLLVPMTENDSNDYIDLGICHRDRTLFSRALDSWFISGK